MQDIVSLVQQVPPVIILPAAAVVAAAVIYFTNKGQAPAQAPKLSSPPKKSNGGENTGKDSSESSKKSDTGEKPSSFDGTWKSEPHQVASNALQSAAAALHTAKEVSTPDAPDHVKEAAKALTEAAVKTLEVVAPATKAAVDLHKDDGEERMTSDEWLDRLGKMSIHKNPGGFTAYGNLTGANKPKD